MAFLATNGCLCQCTFGAAPCPLNVLPTANVLVTTPAASIMDNVPFVNIISFSMCTSLANPTVAAATSAALGVLTPMPCIPVTTAPWMPGKPTVLVGGKPALTTDSKLLCTWGGVISISAPAQFTCVV